MLRYQCKESGIMKNQKSTPPPKETKMAPITDPKEIDFCEMPDKEFRIIRIQNVNWYSHYRKQYGICSKS